MGHDQDNFQSALAAFAMPEAGDMSAEDKAFFGLDSSDKFAAAFAEVSGTLKVTGPLPEGVVAVKTVDPDINRKKLHIPAANG